VAEGVEMARPGGRLVSIGVGGGPVTLSPMIFFK
jgi:threonine dehydrogenase-like Zn-dependent dehydrogenase